MGIATEPQRRIAVVDSSQVGEARREAARLARSADLSETRAAEVAIIATELGNNLVRYGKNGQLLLQILRFDSGVRLELIAVDSGPGMSDLHRCMQDGYSTGGTPGTGLGAVRRLSDEFDAYSRPDKGTVVMSRVRAGGRHPVKPEDFSIGGVSIPAPGEMVCGDAWCVVERPGQLAVMVADGLGHGPQAAEASTLAQASFRAEAFAAPAVFFERAHRDLAGSRGAAIASAQIIGHRNLRYSGVGNISGTLVSPDRQRGLPTQNGTVGGEMRRVAPPAEYEWPERGLLVMHSDGLTARWTFDAYPGLLVRHPAVVAAILWRDFVRGRDDATVVVVAVPVIEQ